MIRATLVFVVFTSVSAYSQTMDDLRIGVELWSDALSRPAAFTFIGPGEMLVVENATGEVLHLKDGLVQNIALDVITSAEGALGITCHPDFPSNGYVYYYHTTASADGGGWRGSEVTRYTFDGESLTDPFGPIFTSPYDLGQTNADNHNGGTLRFGADGMLYGQVGDKHRGSSANGRIELNSGTTESSRSGGIFRIHPGGGVPHDNPFIDHPDVNVRAWYCYGFRNSLGMDFDPVSGELWWSENGPDVYDEINRGGSGMNGGWGLIAGPDARDAVFLKNGYVARDEADLVHLPGSFYRDPEYSLLPTPGVTGVCFLNSKRFPLDLRNNLIYGEVNGQIYNFQLDQAREHLVLTGDLADGVADTLAERDLARFGSGLGLVTEIQMGPDGYLYLADYGGGFIRRIRPLVDIFEPLTTVAVRGSIESGSVADLEFADDATVAMRSAPGWRVMTECSIETTFQMNAEMPTRLDIAVEAGADRTDGKQLIQLWDVADQVWRTVDESPLSLVSQQVTHVTEMVLEPELYIDSATANQVRLRVLHRVPSAVTGISFGLPRSSTRTVLNSEFDMVQLRVTWPWR